MLMSLIFWTIALSLWFAVIIYVIYDGMSKDQMLYEYRDNHLYALTGINMLKATSFNHFNRFYLIEFKWKLKKKNLEFE